MGHAANVRRCGAARQASAGVSRQRAPVEMMAERDEARRRRSSAPSRRGRAARVSAAAISASPPTPISAGSSRAMAQPAAAERDRRQHRSRARGRSRGSAGASSSPPAEASSVSSTDVARQWTRHRPDRPIATRSSHDLVRVPHDHLASRHVRSFRHADRSCHRSQRRYNISFGGRLHRAAAIAPRAREGVGAPPCRSPAPPRRAPRPPRRSPAGCSSSPLMVFADGGGRRHHPADRIGPVDDAVGADLRHRPAAERRRSGRPSSTATRRRPNIARSTAA